MYLILKAIAITVNAFSIIISRSKQMSTRIL